MIPAPAYNDSAGTAAWHVLHRAGKIRPVFDLNALRASVLSALVRFK